jgi:hypothetical protein
MQMAKDRAFMAIYKQGAAHGDWGRYAYAKEGNGYVNLIAPNENGAYELRLYSKDGEYTDATFVIKTTFTVGSSNAAARPSGIGTYSWAGTWDTSWGDMVLTQNGNKVTGAYTHDSGKIDGMVYGNLPVGTWGEEPSYKPTHDAGDVFFIMSQDGKTFTGGWRYGFDTSEGMEKRDGTMRKTAIETAPTTPTTPLSYSNPWSNASARAVPELQKAQGMGLIPSSLNGKDFTQSVNRAEFAAVSVKLYENLTGKKATAPSKNPFTGTSDPEVLKDYNIDLTAGTSATKFSPNDLLTREQAATLSGWTLAADGNFPLKYAKPAAFACVHQGLTV